MLNQANLILNKKDAHSHRTFE